MNRFTYDNIDPDLSAKDREKALNVRGINVEMSKKRRDKKQARHRANMQVRYARSRGE